MARVCSIVCAIDDAKLKQRKAYKKAYKKETARLKQRCKTKAQWLKEAQTEFNKYIRKRDSAEPCISCGRHHTGQYHAGHYRTVAANPELRFSEMNCHKQCSACNNYLSGNIVNYRINLLKKIGEKNLAWLEGSHDIQKFTIDDAKEIKEYYKELNRAEK